MSNRYRILSEGEVIREGDEFDVGYGVGWKKTGSAGLRVGGTGAADAQYRRLEPDDRSWSEIPCGLPIKKGDQFLCEGQWVDVDVDERAGLTVPFGAHWRREDPEYRAVAVGEKIVAGDEYLSVTGKWVTAIPSGVASTENHFRRRRLIEVVISGGLVQPGDKVAKPNGEWVDQPTLVGAMVKGVGGGIKRMYRKMRADEPRSPYDLGDLRWVINGNDVVTRPISDYSMAEKALKYAGDEKIKKILEILAS